MQTNFTDAQLTDPTVAEADAMLKRCVHCGLCIATCPTYVILGDERDSPRGRIYLIKQMFEQGAVTPTVTRHVDRCLSCLSCVTTCPSGVDYMHIVDLARTRIEQRGAAPCRSTSCASSCAKCSLIPAAFAWPSSLAGSRVPCVGCSAK